MLHRIIFVDLADKKIKGELFMAGESASDVLAKMLPSDNDNEFSVFGEWLSVSVKGGDWRCSIRAHEAEYWNAVLAS